MCCLTITSSIISSDKLYCNTQIYPFRNNEAMRLQPGMVFTIEPILTEGDGDVTSWNDGWTAATTDGGW